MTNNMNFLLVMTQTELEETGLLKVNKHKSHFHFESPKKWPPWRYGNRLSFMHGNCGLTFINQTCIVADYRAKRRRGIKHNCTFVCAVKTARLLFGLSTGPQPYLRDKTQQWLRSAVDTIVKWEKVLEMNKFLLCIVKRLSINIFVSKKKRIKENYCL